MGRALGDTTLDDVPGGVWERNWKELMTWYFWDQGHQVWSVHCRQIASFVCFHADVGCRPVQLFLG